ncbi:MAG: hypothetical protein HUU20_04050 [Pirellulales bacterium]|nr:hypothetical protein [Pirellulales bacterium]
MRAWSDPPRWFLIWAVEFTAAATAVGQTAPPLPGGLPPQTELVFEDHFEKPELDLAWKIKAGQWKVLDGALEAKGPDAFLLLTKDAGAFVRLEYTAWSNDPCDLSACLSVDVAASRPSGIFFQFGGMHNKTTAVGYENARLWESTRPLIRNDVRHRVICERWGAFIRFFVDGELLFHGVAAQLANNRNGFAGLFIYNSGWIDDVRLYRFQGEPAGEILKAEPDLKVRQWLGFDSTDPAAVPALPAGWSADAGAGAARVVVVRDYQNADPLPRWIDDQCLELTLSEGGSAPRLQGSFEGQEKGLIEFEVFSEAGEGVSDTGLELALLDAAGRAAAVLATDRQRRFYTEGPAGKCLLDPIVTYTGINPKPPLRFAQGRWFRIRIHFDAAQGRFTAAIVNMYVPERSYNPFPATGHWFVFGKELPFTQPAEKGRIAGLRLSLVGRGPLRVDNVYAIAPTNGLTVRGKDIRRPARELLGSEEHPHHDPLGLFLYSLRETLGTQGPYGDQNELRGGKHPEVLKAAFAYNELLVEHAFREAEGRALLRAQNAAQSGGKEPAGAAEAVRGSLALVAETERELAGLYRAYLEAYLDGLNADRMNREVAPAAQRLRERLQETQTSIAHARERLGLRPLPDPPHRRVRIEKGRYRTDAGPAFYFPQTNWLFWPEQERLLRLDGCPTVYGQQFFQAPEGRFINGPAFDAYVSRLVRTTPEACFLIADVVGLHSCYTLTPD